MAPVCPEPSELGSSSLTTGEGRGEGSAGQCGRVGGSHC